MLAMHPSHVLNAQGTQCERCEVITGEAAAQGPCVCASIVDAVSLTCSCSRSVASGAVRAILDAVVVELDRVVMPRDAWVELRMRLERLRPK